MDYRGLQALYTVIQTQSFENAANSLCLTQSAISQRIKRLEEDEGEPLLIRSLPYQATTRGQSLLGHYKQVMLLEDNLRSALAQQQQQPQITIAINRDCLETWFGQVLATHELMQTLRLEIIADDQELTLSHLQTGMASACLSTQAKPLSGCQAQTLGNMEYCLVATPAFKAQYFKHRIDTQQLLKAPAVIFDRKDQLLDWFLQRYYDINEPHQNTHRIPSVQVCRAAPDALRPS